LHKETKSFFVGLCNNSIKNIPSKVPHTAIAGTADQTKIFEIAEVYVHPKYNGIHNDIALVRLKEKIM
jgi:hypothetical protein